MKKSSLTVVVSMLAVFLSGALVGAFGHRLYTVRSVNAVVTPSKPTPEDWRRREVHELRTRLNLEDAQVSRLNVILDQTRDRFHAMKERTRPEAEQIRQSQRNSIRAILKASQQAEYEKIVLEKDQKRAQHHKP